MESGVVEQNSRVSQKEGSSAPLESLALDRSTEAHLQGQREGRATGTGTSRGQMCGSAGAPLDEGKLVC